MQNTDRQAPLHTQSSCGVWGPSYCYSTYVTPRPMKAGKHIPKTQSKSCFPGGANGKQSACQCRRHKRRGFDPWVGKIPWRSKWQPTPVFLEPGNSMGRGASEAHKRHEIQSAAERWPPFLVERIVVPGSS